MVYAVRMASHRRQSKLIASTPLLTEEAARQLLAPLEPAFIASHLRAWSKWARLEEVCADAGEPELTFPFTATTRANIVNNHCVGEIAQAIEPHLDPDRVRLYDGWGFATVIVTDERDSALVRFKLLDPDLRTRNVSTMQQENLDRQEWDESLLGEIGFNGNTPPTVVTCGYQLAADDGSIESS